MTEIIKECEEQLDITKDIIEENNDSNEKHENKNDENEKTIKMMAEESIKKVSDEIDDDDDGEEESCVPQSAFWHIEASTDNGFVPGMLVEVEHLQHKYWLASVMATFGQLLSLKWEGAPSEPDFWWDLKSMRCFPVGYYRDKREFKIEPPANLRLESKEIIKVTVKYFSKKQTHLANSLKLTLFTKFGFINPIDIFRSGTVLEVSHDRSPQQFWFASVMESCGGRLKLKWIETVSNGNNSNDSEPSEPSNTDSCDHFYLFFCHPRVNYLGFANTCQHYSYVSHKPIENTQEIIVKMLRESDSEYSQVIKNLIISAKSRRPPLYETESIEKINVNDKVLVFPLKTMQLLPASVTCAYAANNYLFITCDNDADIQFCYPNDDNCSMMAMNWGEEQHINVDFGENLKDESQWNRYLNKHHAKAAPLKLHNDERLTEFEINQKLEVVHPKDPSMICEGNVIRITPPLIWIEIASDLITVLPYNSCDLFPLGWCHTNGKDAVRLLNKPLKNRDNKKNKTKDENQNNDAKGNDTKKCDNEDMHTDSELSNESNLPSHLQCSPKSWCPRIFINHKCFTGPTLSKSKICELPQYLGPGPIMLVLQEVISKIISVAYVPSRVLNELSSKTFEDLLIKKGIKKAQHVVFKAKYQKRSYRDQILVTHNADQVEEYCRCVCGHLKCCYNLFSPQQFSGDECPSNCRGLTKSNKYLRRPTYYRDKARYNKLAAQKKKMTLIPSVNEEAEANDEADADDEEKDDNKNFNAKSETKKKTDDKVTAVVNDAISDESIDTKENFVVEDNDNECRESETQRKALEKSSDSNENRMLKRSFQVMEEDDDNGGDNDGDYFQEMDSDDLENENMENNPLYWSITDVYNFLKKSECQSFASTLRDHEVDGAALLLLDYGTITGQLYSGYTRQYSLSDALKLTSLIERLKGRWTRLMKR